jgi:diacylglycerol kinase (ATP)
MRVMVVYNPAAGSRRRVRLERTLRLLLDLGCAVDVRQTGQRGDAEGVARAAALEGFDRLVVAGGDGTINEAVNGLGHGGGRTALALVPIGTANVLATEIGLDPSPRALAAAIVGGVATDVCLGRVRDAEGQSRMFTLMAGAGFDAHVVAGVDPELKRWLGKGAYVAEMARQLAVFSFPRYRITVDGAIYGAASVVVANARHYGGAFSCAPDARLDDPRLHVCLFDRVGRFATLAYAVALARGTLSTRGDYRIVAGSRVRIEGPEFDPVQADGDIVARLPVDIDVVPAGLNLMMPPRRAAASTRRR